MNSAKIIIAGGIGQLPYLIRGHCMNGKKFLAMRKLTSARQHMDQCDLCNADVRSPVLTRVIPPIRAHRTEPEVQLDLHCLSALAEVPFNCKGW